jgi:hypothetical protein
MVNRFAFVVGSLLVGLVTPPGLSRHHAAVPPPGTRVAATVDSFSPPPPKAKKRRTAAPRPASSGATTKVRENDGTDNSEEDKPPPRQRAPTPIVRRRVPAAEDAEEEETAGDREEEDDAEEDKPRSKRVTSKRRASRDGEEEDEGDDTETPIASRPAVVPRLISFGLGGSAFGRRFSFNTPLQKESTFPRPGFAASLESYPLIRAGSGWLSTLGIGADLAMEFGSAALQQAGGGPTVSFPVTERRYAFDVRYAVTVGDRVVIVPAIGLGNSTFDLKTNVPIPPSSCSAAMNTQPCIPGVRATYLMAGAHLRIAASDDIALSLSAGYQLGLAVGRGRGQVGSERTPAMSGLQFELGMNWMLKDWLGFRLAIPFIRHSFTFSGGTATYTSASETYFGGTVSALIFTR